MNEINSIEQIIIPEVPKVIDTEQLHIYVPVVSTGNFGISKFNSEHFTIINGTVYAKLSLKAISDEEGRNIVSTYQTKEDLVNDLELKIPSLKYIDNFITNTVNDLKNYYSKSETYSQLEINNLISSIPKFSIEVVENLPIENIKENTVYLLKSIDENTNNLYIEYIYINSQWEKLGSQNLDLDNYYSKDEVYSKDEADELLDKLRDKISSLDISPEDIDELYSKIDMKQDTLIPGEGISIVDNIISAIIPNDGGGGETPDLSNVVDKSTNQLIKGQKDFTITPRVRFGGSRLPDEFQEVEFIKANGAQYINTGVLNGSNIGFEFDVAYTIKYSDFAYPIGAADKNECFLYITGNNTSSEGGRFYYNEGKVCGLKIPYSEQRVKISLMNKRVYRDYVELKDVSTYSFQGTQPIYVCAFNNNGAIQSANNTWVYGLKMYQDGILIRDFVPCYRINDNTTGLYDLIESKFYVNVGVGRFERGADVIPPSIEYSQLAIDKDVVKVNEDQSISGQKTFARPPIIRNSDTLPSEYQQVAWLGTSKTQWIDTGLKVFSYTNFEIEYDISFTEFYNYNCLYGADSGTTLNEVWIDTSGNLYARYNQVKSSAVKLILNTRYKIKLTYDGTTYGIYVNNELKTSFQPSPRTTEDIFYLFKRDTSYTNATIYRVSIKLNEGIVLDLIPCYRKSDEVAGFYNIVDNTFFENAGSGTFYKGANKYIGDKLVTEKDLEVKQDKLTAGTGITIENNVISATGGTKLYKHYLNGSSPITIINNTSTPISRSFEGLCRAVYNSLSAMVNPGGIAFTNLFAVEDIMNEATKLFYVNYQGDLIEMNDLPQVDDVVTEL